MKSARAKRTRAFPGGDIRNIPGIAGGLVVTALRLLRAIREGRKRTAPERAPLATAAAPRSLARDVRLNAMIASLGRPAPALREAELYARVADEIMRGKVDRVLWVRTFFAVGRDRTLHRGRYLKDRVAQLRKFGECSDLQSGMRSGLLRISGDGHRAAPPRLRPHADRERNSAQTRGPERRHLGHPLMAPAPGPGPE